MKVLILLGLAAVGFAHVLPDVNDAPYSIIAEELIPLGESIRKAEEQMKNNRIIGGSPAVLGEVPYQVGTLINFVGISGTGVCGGSLVSANRVISAAHCWNDGVHQALRVTVVAGSLTLFSGGQRIDSSVVAVHPDFSILLVRNDVSVIYLPVPVTISAIVSPVALPSGDELSNSFNGQRAIASGYGLTSDGGVIDLQASLNVVALTVISNDACWWNFPGIIQDSNICTSSFGGVSTCRGDSGGPLVVNSDGRRVLIGITSFGHRAGCEAGLPAAFARASSFVGFFNQHL